MVTDGKGGSKERGRKMRLRGVCKGFLYIYYTKCMVLMFDDA